MSIKRVCNMTYQFPVPAKAYWAFFLDTVTRLSTLNPSDIDPQPEGRLQHMTIESVDQEKRTLKNRYTISEFFQGYKMVAATTRIINKSGGLHTLVECSVEYEKNSPEINDLEEVKYLRATFYELAHHVGHWASPNNFGASGSGN